MISRKFRFEVLLIALSAGLVLYSNPALAAAVSEKIAPRVLTETAGNATTEALVVLADQADLTPASSLQTKLEKGRFVVNALRAVADRTQAPILALLQQRGISYQSFYIVNMIKVTGNRALMHHAVVYLRTPGSQWLYEYPKGVPFVPRPRSQRPKATLPARRRGPASLCDRVV